MPERQIIQMPGVPAPVGGVAGGMPGADTRHAVPVTQQPIRLNTKAPDLEQRAGGVVRSADAMVQDDVARAHEYNQVAGAFDSTLQRIGAHVEEVYETGQIASAEMKMEMAKNHFMESRPMNPDSWGKLWEDTSKDVANSILGDPESLTPKLRLKLERNFVAFDAGMRNTLDSQMLSHKTALAHQQLEALGRYQWEHENIPDYAATQARMAELGMIAPETANLNVTMLKEKADFNAKTRFAYNQPFEAEGQIERMNLTPGDRFQISKLIEGRKAEVRRDEFATALNMTLNNKVMPEEIWRKNVEMFAPHLEPTDIENLNKHRLDTMETSPETFNKFLDKARSFTSETPAWEIANFEREVGNNIQRSMQNNILSVIGGRDLELENRIRKTLPIVDAHFDDMLAPENFRKVPSEFLVNAPGGSKFGAVVSKAKIEAAKAKMRREVISYLAGTRGATPDQDDKYVLGLGIPLPPKTAAEEKEIQRKQDLDRHSIKKPGWRWQKYNPTFESDDNQLSFESEALSHLQ